jgi:PBSX family phage terminase large subunit
MLLQNFDLTPKQYDAIDLMVGDASNIMLYGGSRSGKTFLAVYAIFVRAAKEPGSRHCILREKFAHAVQSIWLDTIPKMLQIAMPDLGAKANKSRYFYQLPNGSEIWIGGLDNADRAEKILGNEYSTMYFNECSQLDFESISLARTRLAQKNKLTKKTYYDQNPPKRSHWSYWLFEKGIDPLNDEVIENPEDFVSILMNPGDNLDNIDPEYIKMLEKLPEKQKNRFLLGLYDDESDGNVYYAFNRDRHVKPVKQLPGTIFVGMDFNVDPMTAVICQVINNKIQVFDEVYLHNSDTYKMCDELKRRGYGGVRVIPDSTGRNRKTSGQSDFDIIKESGFVIESTYNPFVTDRVNNVNRLFTNDEIIIDNKCKKLIADLEKVVWRDNKLDQKTNKHLTHVSDCLGYIAHKLKPFKKLDLRPRAGKR